ncbi:hypothetical protein R7O12_14410 [Vibrio sp. Vb1574]|uniref:hypothetical protein n=1 Tax=Vibrio sp. Vb1574 TaxID=3074643 RepID=UPI0014281F76|nr:hypothetical protein [Vibrio sp. Vb1574]MDW1890407.1 hypothetical protein [Vibrio sp. Vb1574]QIR88861.1 hypothetical protein FQ332_09470 [Vibrio diabolicus]
MLDVLILAPQDDIHALSVSRELEAQGYCSKILDVASVPLENTVEVSCSSSEEVFFIGEKTINTSQLLGVWNRRPKPPKVSSLVAQEDDAEFSVRSTRAALYGGLSSICSNWVNPIPARSLAILKPYQLSIAKKCGFLIPDTLITTNANSVREFVNAQSGDVIYKTVSTWHYGLKETRILTRNDLESLDSLSACPTIFQNHIQGDVDLRITIVGDQLFPASVHFSEGRSPVDGRLDKVPIKRYELEKGFSQKLLEYHRKLGLLYGAYDFRLNKDGVPVFLEVNPDGQFLYVEMATDLPISKAVASQLAKNT